MDVVNLMVRKATITVDNQTREYPTVSAAAAALRELLRMKQRMADKGLFPELISTEVLVRIYLANKVLVSSKPGARITVSVDGEESPTIPSEEAGKYCFDPFQGLFIDLPPELEQHINYQGCRLEARNACVRVFLPDFSQIENPTRFLERILTQVSRFLESALSVPVS